ncbi:MAG: DUF3108 domain-containing protein [Alphaproteobacteria bacterium]|nr:DUF3108 domain-containing protein [Alphaproteobacteria bacterium]
MAHGFYKTVLSIAVAAVIGATVPAQAQEGYKPYYENVALRYDVTEPNKLGLRYDVYAGGLKALNANLVLDLTKEAYDIGLKAETDGFIGSMFPWEAQYKTSGHSEGGVLIPSISTSSSTWRKSVKITEMQYDPKGNLLKTTTKAGEKVVVNNEPKKDLAQGAVDMLTGAMLMMQNAKNTEKCEGSFPVFDGKRRFNINLTDDGRENLAKSEYSKFSGDALRCTLKVEPVAGFKPKDKDKGWMAVQNHTEARKKLPTIWFARLEEQGPVVPVRMEISSEYGAVVAHLSGAAKK